jgi:hypothetical protein
VSFALSSRTWQSAGLSLPTSPLPGGHRHD